jgi:hypothetical protein
MPGIRGAARPVNASVIPSLLVSHFCAEANYGFPFDLSNRNPQVAVSLDSFIVRPREKVHSGPGRGSVRFRPVCVSAFAYGNLRIAVVPVKTLLTTTPL